MAEEDSRLKCRKEGCAKTFSLKTNRGRHEKSCDGKVEKDEIICSEKCCTKAFKKKYNCDHHEKMCERPKEMEKVNKCYLCKKTFSKQANLETFSFADPKGFY